MTFFHQQQGLWHLLDMKLLTEPEESPHHSPLAFLPDVDDDDHVVEIVVVDVVAQIVVVDDDPL